MKAENQPNETYISLVEFNEFLFQNTVPLEEITDSQDRPIIKMLPYWRKNNLVPFLPKNSWARISFAELIWIRILDTLGQFAYPIEKTKLVAEYFFKDAYENHLPEKNLKHNKQQFEKKKTAGTISQEEENTLHLIEDILSDDGVLHVLKLDINYFSNLITNAISSGEDAGILIFQDGSVAEYFGGEYYSHRLKNVNPTNPHIYLSIVHYLKEFIKHSELSTLLLPQLLNDDEKKILKEMRIKNVKEIKVELNNGEIKRIESTKDGSLSANQMKQLKEILGLNSYEKIQLETRDEKAISFRRTKKFIKPRK